MNYLRPQQKMLSGCLLLVTKNRLNFLFIYKRQKNGLHAHVNRGKKFLKLEI